MKNYILILLVASGFSVFGQTSEKYNSEYADYFRGEELFEKEQYGAARKEFRMFIDGFNNTQDPLCIKARYYEAISALELYNNDAITLLEQFNKDYPESIYKKDIYFRLGKFHYYKQQYKKALEWLAKLSAHDLEPEDVEEFYFKIGYSNFKLEQYDAARDAFYEVKEGTSEYANPALYYYSHIAYQNEQYQTALDGFLRLENNEKFGKVVVYYIAQIYYLQGRYDKVTEYASRIHTDGNVVNERDMNHLIGDAYYRTNQYSAAIPYLEKYDRAAQTTRADDYRLGYSYYKMGRCEQAIRMLDRVKREQDSLGQVAYYHVGECMLKMDNKVSARSAFEAAAFIDADPVIEEDALYNFAILSYDLDINPYDEAVEAFELYLNKYPNSERHDNIYQYLVNVYTTTNNHDKALSSLDKIPNKDIKLKTAYQMVAFNQGVERYQKGDYDGAVKSFVKVDKYPVDPQFSGLAAYWKADSYFRLRKYDEAIASYNTFISMPGSGLSSLKQEAQYNVGYAYYKKDDKQALIGAFRSYLQSGPRNDQKKADANMRIADAYYAQYKNQESIDHYHDAVSLKRGSEDRGLFYMARAYRYSERPNECIRYLRELVNDHKESQYMQRALYDLAETHKSIGQNGDALTYYRRIATEYPESQLVPFARMNIAFIYSKQGKITEAEMEYKEVLQLFGNDQKVCETATGNLKDLYLSNGQPEKVEQLAAQYACLNLDPNDHENIYYLPAVEAYQDSTRSTAVRYPDAIAKFQKYLDKFPNGRYASDVKYYMADCHYEQDNIAEAVSIYRDIIDGGSNHGHTEMGAARVSKYLYNNGDYQNAIVYYDKVERISSSPENVFNARIGLMRSYFITENFSKAARYADKVLNDSRVKSETRLEGHYVKGIANYKVQQYPQALTSLEWLISNTTTERGAEARWTKARIQFEQGNFSAAHASINNLLKMKPAYNYWIAKGLILQTRVYMVENNLYDAEQKLKSVMDHYLATDDGILDEANELWDELMQLKNTPKNVSPDGETTIEINEEGNEDEKTDL